MGRKPSKTGAIPHLRQRKQKSGVVHYYYDHGGKPRKETPLGSDYGLAVKKWADIENERSVTVQAALTFRHVCEAYRLEVMVHKATRTQKDNALEMRNLLRFFDDPPGPIDGIRPVHVREFLRWRTKGGTGRVRANREKALLSHIWNFARDKGYTDLPNPCAGIKGFQEEGRDVYIEDDQFAAILDAADQCVKDAMELAYLTGQRPADVLSLTEMDVRAGVINVSQGKTGAKVRIAVEGELEALLERLRAGKSGHKVRSTRLIVNEKGVPMSVQAMSRRWAKARAIAAAKGLADVEGLQFRDLRAKAATDKAESAGDIRQAQKQMGHTTVTMTEHYTRKRRGEKATPTR